MPVINSHHLKYKCTEKVLTIKKNTYCETRDKHLLNYFVPGTISIGNNIWFLLTSLLLVILLKIIISTKPYLVPSNGKRSVV